MAVSRNVRIQNHSFDDINWCSILIRGYQMNAAKIVRLCQYADGFQPLMYFNVVIAHKYITWFDENEIHGVKKNFYEGKIAKQKVWKWKKKPWKKSYEKHQTSLDFKHFWISFEPTHTHAQTQCVCWFSHFKHIPVNHHWHEWKQHLVHNQQVADRDHWKCNSNLIFQRINTNENMKRKIA